MDRKLLAQAPLEAIIALESAIIEDKAIPKWIAGQQTPAKGELITFLGNVYRATGEVGVAEELQRNPALSNVSYAMHPLSSIKVITQLCIIEDIQIEIRSNQVWVYLPDCERTYNNHIIMGDSTFYNHAIHDVCGLNFKIAFNGLLKHHKMELLGEFLQK
ncbi:hypothetical protein OTK49_02710 [Vibrio coralliirubri]|uniref:hypothetical protein n=1 Tax=Vibrio coralliirubri TaxID=1516159 RepID=UPI002283EACD|nr:hypothetical protein [Vibrio coralliirubri]MCY9861429.1 hypothetical protein [Vibrio coralliirubri]